MTIPTPVLRRNYLVQERRKRCILFLKGNAAFHLEVGQDSNLPRLWVPIENPESQLINVHATRRGHSRFHVECCVNVSLSRVGMHTLSARAVVRERHSR